MFNSRGSESLPTVEMDSDRDNETSYSEMEDSGDDEYYLSDYDTEKEYDTFMHSSHLSYLASSSASPSPSLPSLSTSLHLFRLNSLRLHDNPALCASLNRPGTQFKGVFILDPFFTSGGRKYGVNKWRFLIECLQDLKRQLMAMNLQLYVARGLSTAVLSKLCKEWDVVHLTYQASCEPKSSIEESAIDELCSNLDIEVEKFHTHSLYNPSSIIELNGGKPITTFKEFSSLFPKLGHPLPPLPPLNLKYGYFEDDTPHSVLLNYQIPTLSELGFNHEQLGTNPWIGGETEALKRLEVYCSTRKNPFKDPVDMLFDKTSLSPYIRFGCLSVRHFWYYVQNLSSKDKRLETLRKDVVAKLLQREFYFIVSSQVSNFESDIDNWICLPLPWESDTDLLYKWTQGLTGYPWIDAAIKQLHQEGWIHYQLRECIATFLTRGDLWISWVHGKDAFEALMLDYEPSVSCGCWMKSSACSFITGSLEHYCPITFGQKLDPEGHYIRRYLPQLQSFPKEYIFSPWMAPRDLQEQCNCIIGIDYPFPIVDHVTAGTICVERLKQSFKSILKQ